MRAGWLGWQHSAVTAVGTSRVTSACWGFSPPRWRFQVQTTELSVLQSPLSILWTVRTHTHTHITLVALVEWKPCRNILARDPPAVGTGDDPSCAAPGHSSHMQASLCCAGVLEAMKTRHLEKHSNQSPPQPSRRCEHQDSSDPCPLVLLTRSIRSSQFT